MNVYGVVLTEADGVDVEATAARRKQIRAESNEPRLTPTPIGTFVGCENCCFAAARLQPRVCPRRASRPTGRCRGPSGATRARRRGRNGAWDDARSDGGAVVDPLAVLLRGMVVSEDLWEEISGEGEAARRFATVAASDSIMRALRFSCQLMVLRNAFTARNEELWELSIPACID